MASPPEDAPGRRSARRSHPLARMLIYGTIASVLGTALVLYMDWFPEQGSTAAKDIDELYDILLIASVPIFVLVMAVAIYCVIVFRARPGDRHDGEPIHGNTKLEIIWVTIPFIIVTGLAIYSWIVLDDIEAKKPDELNITVTGEQFTWSFEYPEQKVKTNELVLPVDRPVFFRIKAKDVIHSFWVPEFRLKSDAVPGLTTNIRVTPDKEGEWRVVCAELCGIGHSTMRQKVRVVDQDEFDKWLAEETKGPPETGAGGEGAATGDQASAGKQIFTETGCNACHTLADAGSTSEVGPKLDELAEVAGKRKAGMSPEDYIEESIVKPEAFVVKGFPPGTMPTTYGDDLTPQEIDALVKYLLEVGGGSPK